MQGFYFPFDDRVTFLLLTINTSWHLQINHITQIVQQFSGMRQRLTLHTFAVDRQQAVANLYFPRVICKAPLGYGTNQNWFLCILAAWQRDAKRPPIDF